MATTLLDTKVHKLSGYPIIKHYMDALKITSIFSDYIPLVKGKPILVSSLCVLIVNLLEENQPLYRVSEWLRDYADGQSEFGYESNAYTDDRLGDSLDALWLADRNSILSRISSQAISVYELETSVVHNDTTSVTLQGHYNVSASSSGEVTATQGYNKDGCPDCKQLVFGLNMLGDGHVPISMKMYSGNTSDSSIHCVNWNELRNFLQKEDFIYIADSKLASEDSMKYIAGQGGCFISILPATRLEVREFKVALQAEILSKPWETIGSYPDSRKKGQVIEYEAYEGLSTQEGYSLLWVRSSAKKQADAARREAKLQKISDELKSLQTKLNKRKLKTIEQIQAALERIAGTYLCYFSVDIEQKSTFEEKKVGRGRVGKNTKYELIINQEYTLTYKINTAYKKQVSLTDGIFPLVHNTGLAAQKVLEHYKKQPYLEKKFSTLKSVLKVVPIWLNKPKRIEAMLFLFFIALMIVSLIERRIRKQMEIEKIKKLPILPRRATTQTPTWYQLRWFFRSVFMMVQESANQTLHYCIKGLSELHKKVLRLMEVPLSKYQIKQKNWWEFSSA